MTTRSAKSKTVTIFEGPDGAGKSTLAMEYAALTDARYFHHGPYKQVNGHALSRLFAESLLPALLGHEDVVLDRCWISEPIYADAFRQGKDRVGLERARQLDRLAMRCGAVVVKCLPPWAHVRACFTGRADDEYLDNEQQLLQVYGAYQHDLNTHLHEVEHDYTKHLDRSLTLTASGVRELVNRQRDKNPAHPLSAVSAGNWLAPVLVVGDSFAERTNADPLYQWPFGSLSNLGCSTWLSTQLEAYRISEQSLLWINADQLTEAWVNRLALRPGGLPIIIALGQEAQSALIHLGLPYHAVNHPQYWKRFQHGSPYPLGRLLKELLS